jgi:hypothetical protein
MRVSKTSKLIAALERGDKLTLAQVGARFKLKDPAVAMSDLRLRNGYAIESAYFTDTKGRVTRKWFLGVVPKSVAALGYRAEYEMNKGNDMKHSKR